MAPTRIDEHIVITRAEALALLRGQALTWKSRPESGSTMLSASLRITLSEEVLLSERAKAIDALTAAKKPSHMEGWQVRPDGFAIPEPGSTAWIAYMVSNADRIMVRDANGVSVALRDLPPERQRDLFEGWLLNGHTPEPAERDTYKRCPMCEGARQDPLAMETAPCPECGARGAVPVDSFLARVSEVESARAANALTRREEDASFETEGDETSFETARLIGLATSPKKRWKCTHCRGIGEVSKGGGSVMLVKCPECGGTGYAR